MTLYALSTGVLKEVQVKPFKLERDIQTVAEQNLQEVMALTLVRSEFHRLSIQKLDAPKTARIRVIHNIFITTIVS